MNLSSLRSKARGALKGKWFSFVGYTILLFLLNTTVPKILENIGQHKSNVGVILSILYEVLVISALTLGSNSLYLKLSKGEEVSLGTMFLFFTSFNRHRKAIIYYLLIGLYLFLWSLLLIIPGIIKSFSYAMAPYILIEEPHMTANEAITKSRQMMNGYKWKLFCLYLSFVGWLILSIITIGIGFLWLSPYSQTSIAYFYNDIKEN